MRTQMRKIKERLYPHRLRGLRGRANRHLWVDAAATHMKGHADVAVPKLVNADTG